MQTPKTSRRLRREIAYFVGVITRSTDREAIRRARVAIREREAQLRARGFRP